MLTQFQENDLKLLRIFRAVVNCGGFSAAQAELNMTQPSISLHMAQLEDRLGMRLCSRGNTGFRLTHEGQFIFHQLTRLFAAIDEFRFNTTEYFSNVQGTLTVGVPDLIATHSNPIIIEILRTFSAAYPLAKLNVEVLNAYDLELKTIRGDLDLAFGFFYHEVDSLIYREVLTERHLLYCGKGHVLYDVPDTAMSIDQLRELSYVGRGHYEEAPFFRHDLPFKEQAVSMYMEGLALLILTGRFIGYLPDHYAQHWVDRGDMRPLLEGSLSKSAPCRLAMKRGVTPSRALSGFLDVVEKTD